MCPSPGPLLGVWAHPDDEAFLSAGLMTLARWSGRRVVVATATWGENGTDDPDRWPPARLARERQVELTRSLAAVDVTEHHHLGHVDGRCASIDERRGVDAVARLIEQLRPELVVTFGPEGMTGHPDHRAVSRWTTVAWHATGRRSRLWYATVTPEFHQRWGALNEQVGLWMAGEPPCTPRAELAHRVPVRGELLERKLAALDAHRTQTAPLRALVGDGTWAAWWAEEAFVAA
jgi:LmbE family N-acetylglucosaminyl deacetylase